MSFDNVRLPDDIERGAAGGPTFNTEITALRNGHEQRRAVWSRARQAWDIGYSIQAAVDYVRILNFFYARQGRFRGFRFRDWSDYSVSDESFGTGDGSTVEFQLVKNYTSGTTTYTRRITRPVDAIVVTGDGAVDYETGLVTYPIAPTTGTALQWTGEFDIPCRFNTDVLNTSIEHLNAMGAPSIPVVEILE